MGHDSSRWLSACLGTGSASVQNAIWTPLVDIYRTRDGWLIKYDLAGVQPEDVKLTIAGRRLTLCGERRDCCVEEGCSHYCMEISYSRFERTIELPVALEGTAVSMEAWHGFLLVNVIFGTNHRGGGT